LKLERWLLGLSAIALIAPGCDAPASSRPRPSQSASAATPSAAPAPSASQPAAVASAESPELAASELTWKWPETPVGPMQVVVSLPVRRQNQRFPVLITMHGRGEASKGPAKGARGWIDDYWMTRAIERLRRPPLGAGDLLELGAPDRIARMNAALAERPYGGMIVVCPYTPDILAGDRPFSAARPLADFFIDQLLPRVRSETPAIGSPESTGIDGVSLGGRAALLVGLERSTEFGVVAGLQAAFDSADAAELARRASSARDKNPKLVIRLLTSERDYFLNANRAISRAMSRAGVPHVLAVIPGPHDYGFNRGPGAYEMLFFHDRALRGELGIDELR
jgi:iron(III)-salmochelin esterase